MQTSLGDKIKDTFEGREADAILRSCVHCGFCNATCPTYQLTGDELDGPRGRIYLIKQLLEGHEPGTGIQLHLDRCLSCRSCETTCPAGVRYHRLLDIGRELTEARVPRTRGDRSLRRWLRRVLPYPGRFATLLRLGRMARPLLPAGLRRSVPPASAPTPWPAPRHARTMILLDGCAQPSLAPNINAATARVLDRLGISLIRARGAGCCGAISHHLSAAAEGLGYMRRNIDAWWPHLEAGAEAIVTTASGCGVQVKDYGDLLRYDPAYADKAQRVSAVTRDIGEVLAPLERSSLRRTDPTPLVAFHAPCTLLHGQRIDGLVEGILRDAGYAVTPVADAHLCCGSAGTYSLLQAGFARHLRQNKLAALLAGRPRVIATANIGCLHHLQAAAPVPVKHWIELLDPPATAK